MPAFTQGLAWLGPWQGFASLSPALAHLAHSGLCQQWGDRQGNPGGMGKADKTHEPTAPSYPQITPEMKKKHGQP